MKQEQETRERVDKDGVWLLGGHTWVAAASYADGAYLALCIMSDAQAAEARFQVLVSDPPASRYVAVPWFFVLDRDGSRRATVCLCHNR